MTSLILSLKLFKQDRVAFQAESEHKVPDSKFCIITQAVVLALEASRPGRFL